MFEYRYGDLHYCKQLWHINVPQKKHTYQFDGYMLIVVEIFSCNKTY